MMMGRRGTLLLVWLDCIRSRDYTSVGLIVPRVRLVIDDVKGGMKCSQDLECCSLF